MSGGATLFTDATIIDGTGAPAREQSWVHIEGGRIRATGQGQPPDAEGARAIPLAGRTLLPGLTDMHMHLGPLREAKWKQKLSLAYGVTTIKETGNDLGDLAAIRRWMAEDPVQPRMFVSGTIMNGSEAELRFLPGGPQTRRLLETALAFGVDFLKVHNWISSGSFTQIMKFSRQHDKPLTGHVPLSMTSVSAIKGGMSILEHVRLQPGEVHDDPLLVADYPMDLVVVRRTAHWGRFDPRSAAIRRTLDAWEARRDEFFIDPTLSTQESTAFSGGPGAPDLPLELVSSAARARWRPSDETFGLSPAEVTRMQEALIGALQFVSLARERGIRILTGTDSSVPWVVPGASLLREIELLVKAGMTPVAAIHASTGQAAAALRRTDGGTLREGAVADIVIARGDVSRDIGSLHDIEQVMLAGIIHERASLLAAAAEHAAADAPQPVEG